MEALAALPPPAAGEHQRTAALSRYQGNAIWSPYYRDVDRQSLAEAHGFVEVDRYIPENDPVPFLTMRLAPE